MAGFKDLFEAALNAEGVTGQLADVARSIHQQESGGGRNSKTSNAGARGGMQIIPSTFKSVADKDWNIDDPLQNARAGIRYLKQLDKQSGGNPALTAAGYYGGPGGLEKARKGIAVSDPRNPNAPNTLQYGQQVAARLPTRGVAPVALAPAPKVAEVFAQAPTPAPQTPGPIPTQMAALAPQDPVAPAPASVVQEGADPWMEFQRQMSRPAGVQASDLAYGQQPAYVPPPIQRPDFQSMASYAQPRAVDFRAFGSFGGRG